MNFEDLYNKHKSMVYNLALNYIQNIEDAQEITQDVFVTVHQSINSFQEASSLSTWIYRITINKCLDFLKAKKRKKRFTFLISLFSDGSNDLKHNPPDHNHPGILLEDKEALDNLFKKINELPDNQKTALILHKIEQKSQVEVAEIMNLSPKALESLIQRAKTNLSKKISNSEG
ncbi:MAG: RNA polymerase sigma factor [Saprospiraceae bacterium]